MPSATVSQTDPLVGTVLGGRYRIDALLGCGGMGSVYRAEHVHMRKAVAIKVLHPEMTALSEVVARFEREAIAAARIEHPNVAQATDFGQLEDGSYYLVMEYVEGKSLRALLDQEHVFAPGRVVEIGRQIAGALAAAHAAHIIHRDLKPDNVMLVTREGTSEWVKVLDFGIAKVSAEDMRDQPVLTQYGSVFGTPDYMSPEQALGQAVDHRADLYALGVILYEMLTGANPFSDSDIMIALTRQMTTLPPPLPAHIPEDLGALVMELLAKDPGQRVQTADELVARFSKLQPQSAVGPTLDDPGLSDTVFGLPAPALAPAAGPSAALAQVKLAGPKLATLAAGARNRLLAWMVTVRARALPLMLRRVRIRERAWPLWQLVAVSAGFLGLLVLVLSTVHAERRQTDDQRPAPSRAPSRPAPVATVDWGPLFARATRGDRAALGTLAARSDSQRTAAEWRALGAGYAVVKDYPASLAAYADATRLDPDLAQDPRLLFDVRRAAQEPKSQAVALELAATRLGMAGADLLFDLWVNSRGKPATKALAEAARAQLDQARSHASPALDVALDLMSARSCSAYKALLPRAVEHADMRALPSLNKLLARNGCGFLGFGDCYPCLRADGKLGSAIDRAKARPGPRFSSDPSP